ncbi:MAG: hypothetical protein EOP81_04260 [Variovorax sp.]|nr:MAG: hypothetical protein EOP81_04260 [Variovorax sp.]
MNPAHDPAAVPARQKPVNEEPEITQEESVPTDGKDEKGEQMMKDLGRNKPGPALRDETED